jgi:cytochrome d ubiquinol oxidase subunit II
MSKADIAAGILMFGVTAYALFGGADFGGGFWDLIAGGAERGERPRALIQHSLTPVWEANHVWLIFILVVLWTAFPKAFAAIMTTLYIPIALAAVGIVLRGAGFAFRKELESLSARRAAGASFAISSVLTPFFMGAVAGAIVTGRVPASGDGDPISSWLQPAPLFFGVVFVATSAYLAAVLLVGDAARAGEEDMERYFARRAVGASVIAGAAAAARLVDLHENGRYIFDRLSSEALPLVILSGACGLAVLVLLVRHKHRLIRPLAGVAVGSMVLGWGVAQFPYLLPTSLKIGEAAAPGPTLTTVLVVFLIAAVVVLPSLALLYTLSQRDIVEGDHPSV